MRVALAGDHHLHVSARGQGAPDVLLLHGWVVSGEVWRPVLDRWPDTGAGRLIAVDLRGTGWSGKPPTGYTCDDHARDVCALIDALELRDLVLVGHSMGGQIAQRVALERPASLARLVLVCPVPASGAPMPDAQIAALHALGGHEQGVRQVISMLMVRDVDPAALDRLVLAASATSRAAYHEAFDAWRTADFGARLAGVTTPTTVIAAERDAALPPDVVRATTADRIPGAAYLELPECGHYPQLEAPDLLTRVLREQVELATRPSGP